ncbi:uncharacterized protein BX663DRAFT_438118 [Cokeromyces recurvatus]|uniref:uncharacterized protein n=1 Tax=Cokeromyces recurvatus TaxID=90255 RepID=UPI00221EE94F|nr:uncharacterized protein BX663DRAFT_438118 [Cokeromyces recurvatus]KAI7901279.1 hypothetical protein BX663DRAFT_438118 [Cokeromyces recurvatus]
MYEVNWLFFMNSLWIPFDYKNQIFLEDAFILKGTFVDLEDSHFPETRKVRVFPKQDYLCYLGVRYRLSRIMLPKYIMR